MKGQFTEKIRTAVGLTWEEKQAAIEFARAMGFQSEAAEFPVTSLEGDLEAVRTIEALAACAPEKVCEATELPEDYIASSDSPLPMPEYDLRKHKGLEKLFSQGKIFEDKNLDQLPDTMNVKIVLTEDSSEAQFEAAMNIAFRLGMETTAYEGILLQKESAAGNEIIFTGGEAFAITYEETENGAKVSISGDGEELVRETARFCETFPMQGGFDTWSDKINEITRGLTMRTLDGQLAYLEALEDKKGTAYVESVIETSEAERRPAIENHFPETKFVSYKDDSLVYEKEYDIPWEVDELYDILEKNVYPALKAGQKVRVDAAVSEDKIVRREITDRIAGRLAELGAANEVEVMCSYKQGYSWIDERVNPALAALGNVERVEIFFRPFLPEGETEWADEDGATPHYNNVRNDPEHWYDLPIRYLQELYPIEDAIVEAVGVDKDAVEFRAYEGTENLTYLLKAYDAGGKEVYCNTYLAANSERAYLDAFPGLGKVHPATGYLRVWVDGEQTTDCRIESDVEKIWTIYQTQVLPDVREYTEKVTEGKDLVEAQPFFSTLRLDINASEPNEILNSRQDLFSTLDGLHEDIYFAGTDYFKNYGMEKCGAITDAPGLFLPVIRKVYGKPYFKVSLFSQMKPEPTIETAAGTVVPTLAKWDPDLWMKKYEKVGDKRIATISVGGVQTSVVEAFAKLLDENLLKIAGEIRDVDEIVFETAEGAYRAAVHTKPEPEKDLDIRDIDLMERTLIGYDDCKELMKKIERVPGLNVYQTTVSYKGRAIWAVELMPHLTGYISRVKRLTNHPSELINTRHHANEVAGTNSAFMLMRTLLTEEKYQDLPDKMNLIWIPMENADGAAIHYELQKDNPTWKLHIARFNAVGKEFYYDHFVDETIHTEAKGLKRLFMNRLPDVLIDNHGVPSHEWEQQFAGYTSPSYRGFWLPRSLIYGYFYHIDEERYHSNYTLNYRMQDVIADAFLADEEITEANLSWARQFERYAHAWMPRLFPANYYKNMINYWIPSPYNPEHRYPSVKYPWILCLDYVSEVADETAQGDYLYDCARAHLLHDLAIIGSVSNCRNVYRTEWGYSDGRASAEMTRKRPIVID